MIAFAPDASTVGSSAPASKARRAPAALSTQSGRAMKQASGKSRHVSVNNSHSVGGRISAFLRNEHPHLTAKYVASRTGLKVSTVEKLIERQSTPNTINFLALFAAYGLSFLQAAYGEVPEALRDDFIAAKQARLEARQALIAREIAELRL